MDVFVARQPIFDRDEKVFAYELLFRNGFQNFYDAVSGDEATSAVLSNSFFSIGIDRLTNGYPAFINFTRKLLLEGIPNAFSNRVLVVEVLEDIEPDPEVITACKSLKVAGYTIVLDDFVFSEKFMPLIQLADIIKIDFMFTKEASERKRLVQAFANSRLKFLAEKVETREEYELAKEYGYEYFQGYFFCKPEILSAKTVSGYKVSYMQVLQEINRPDFNFDRIEKILKQDVSLSYRLLRLINSSFYGFKHRIESIKQTLVLLGAKEIKRWINVIAVISMGEDKPDELMINSITRAKFCEALASRIGFKKRESDLFLLGLFSRIDAFVDQPMEKIMSQLPLVDDLKQSFLGEETEFSPLLRLLDAQEHGDWERVLAEAAHYQLDGNVISDLYLKSIQASSEIFSQGINKS